MKLEKATVRIRKGTGNWFKTNTWTEENWFEERKKDIEKDIAELVKKGKSSAPPNGGGFGGEEEVAQYRLCDSSGSDDVFDA